MTNQEIITLSQGLEGVKSLSGFKFAYMVAKNLTKIKAEIDAFRETLTPTKEFNEFESKRIALAEKHSKKDEEGKALTSGNEYVLESKEEFDKELEVLRSEYKEAIEGREKQTKEFDDFLKEESKLELHKISKDDVPTNISAGQMCGIINLIEE